MYGLPARIVAFSIVFAAIAIAPAQAATPAGGTLTDASGPVSYSAGPFPLDNPTPVPLVDAGP